MQVIGITGGVGAGKSAILEYLEENYKVKVLVADRIAQMLMEPDTDCYHKLIKFLPVEVYNEDETINRIVLAERIFRSEELRRRVNRVVHPAVKEYILAQIEEQRKMGVLDFVVIESALLIEDQYDKICDELWYIYASEELRRKRLMRARGYSREKIQQIFAAQISERMYRRSCQVVIDNNGTREEAFYQVAQVIKNKGKSGRGKQIRNDVPLVFGLDIGTRNVVGTVGYKEEDAFYVLAQFMREHETRSMLDGQIHDIGRVARTVNAVKTALEEQLDMTLEEVCIAAAGRVLETIATTIEYVLPEEAVVSEDDVHTLDLLGIEKAQQILNESNDTNLKFYCVGYSIVKYYLNGDPLSNLEGHKAQSISEDIIVTFLPEDVVEGLYSSVELAGLKVASLTLEPIAAISVAIPEAFRMLNIALVDVGAGTSDISITRDGSIIAYGMIPSAGDEITEMLVQHFLVDFKTAEHIKVSSTTEQEIEYQDIMMLRHTVTAEEVWELMNPLVEKLTQDVAGKIKELNGGSTVSATFVVGGGGKVHGFIERLAAELELPKERVALRGEEVLQEIHFEQPEIKKDPLLVTPIGICLSYYLQRNNFIFVWLNGERIKLYDNDKLTILDAALQAGFTNEQLFPGKGKELRFTVNGKRRIVGGEPIAAAAVLVNGEERSLNDPLLPNSEIALTIASMEQTFVCHVADLEEYDENGLTFQVNGEKISCPKYVEADGDIVPPEYEIQENDKIKIHSYYTVAQLLVYLEIEPETVMDIQVNGKQAELDTPLYGNFFVEWHRREQPAFPEGEENIQEEEAAFREDGFLGEGYAHEEFVGQSRRDMEEDSRNGSVDTGNEGNGFSDMGEEFLGTKNYQGREGFGNSASDMGEEFLETKNYQGREDFGNSASDIGKEFLGTANARGKEDSHRERYGNGNQEIREASFGTGDSRRERYGNGNQEIREASFGTGDSRRERYGKSYSDPDGEGTGKGSFGKDRFGDGALDTGGEGTEKGNAYQNANWEAAGQAAGRKTHADSRQGETGWKDRKPEGSVLEIVVNGSPVTLKGKKSYIFVDAFDAIGFNLNESKGRSVAMRLNGEEPTYTAPLHAGDTLEIYWEGESL